MLTEEEKRKILELSSKGQSVAEIARTVRRDRKTVRGVLIGVKGIPTHRSVAPPLASEESGKLAARVFKCFEEGMRPEEVVMKEALDPEVVARYHGQYLALKNKSATFTVEQEVRRMQKDINELREIWATELVPEVDELKERVARIERALTDLCGGDWWSR